jgi:hypothetical protein
MLRADRDTVNRFPLPRDRIRPARLLLTEKTVENRGGTVLEREFLLLIDIKQRGNIYDI